MIATICSSVNLHLRMLPLLRGANLSRHPWSEISGAGACRARRIALALLWSCAFFVAVLEIGLVVATGAFLAVAFILLRGHADRQPLRDLGVAALGAGLIGLLFTRLAPILVSEPLLF
ncbi:hypothetical protein [Elioraea sp.]|uniref:hypothetical protein n=1 Tax=Elioraea sp. TaxID=2185103 RepID=UPI003F708E1E